MRSIQHAYLSASLAAGVVALCAGTSRGAIVIDPNDPRSWQGAGVGTFAQLYYGADTLANRQLVVSNQLLDDGVFNPTGFTSATLIRAQNTLSGGFSHDVTGTGSYDYTISGNVFDNANTIDNTWIQTSGTVGDTVWDLGGLSSFAAVFPTIDHGPLPMEAIESTVYLSNSPDGPWVQASVVRVWLEGFEPNTNILRDGFTYVVTTPGGELFRYASLIHGGPGALINDGDDEINGILGLRTVPTPAGALLLTLGAVCSTRRRR